MYLETKRRECRQKKLEMLVYRERQRGENKDGKKAFIQRERRGEVEQDTITLCKNNLKRMIQYTSK